MTPSICSRSARSSARILDVSIVFRFVLRLIAVLRDPAGWQASIVTNAVILPATIHRYAGPAHDFVCLCPGDAAPGIEEFRDFTHGRPGARMPQQLLRSCLEPQLEAVDAIQIPRQAKPADKHVNRSDVIPHVCVGTVKAAHQPARERFPPEQHLGNRTGKVLNARPRNAILVSAAPFTRLPTNERFVSQQHAAGVGHPLIIVVQDDPTTSNWIPVPECRHSVARFVIRGSASLFVRPCHWSVFSAAPIRRHTRSARIPERLRALRMTQAVRKPRRQFITDKQLTVNTMESSGGGRNVGFSDFGN